MRVAEACLEAGADLESFDEVGYTALRHAVYFRQMDMFRWLLAQGADVNRRDNWTQVQ